MVKQIAADIKGGRWQLTHQAICIAVDGTLLDGQHRLLAIVESDCTVPVHLATNCPPECFTAIDTGHSRTAGDILKMEGVQNYVNIAAIIRIVHCYRTIPELVWVGEGARLSKQHILDYYRGDAATWDEVAYLALACHREGNVLVSAVGAFLYLYFRNGDHHQPKEYLKLYCTGAMLPLHHPILTFRNWQTANWRVASVKKAQTQLACHIKAYKAYRSGISIKTFRAPVVPPMPNL